MFIGIPVATLIVDRVANAIQEKERVANLVRLHGSLSHLLGFLAEATGGNYLHWSKNAIYSAPLRAKTEMLSKIKTEIKAREFRMDVLQEKSVIESADESLPAFHSLSSVAFQISGRHGLLWLAITNSVAQLAKLYPFTPPVPVPLEPRQIVIGQDSFGLNFYELVDHMLQFAEAEKELWLL